MTYTKLTQKIEMASELEIRNDKMSKQDFLWYQNYRAQVLHLERDEPIRKKFYKKKLTRKKK